MDWDREEKIEALQKEYSKLPLDMKKAISWAIEHWELIEYLCKDSDITDTEIKELKAKAVEENDYVLGMIVCAVEVFNRSDEAKEQEN